MSGAIEFANTAVNCIVDDMSIGGAALEVSVLTAPVKTHGRVWLARRGGPGCG
jgi:hypothetical protein